MAACHCLSAQFRTFFWPPARPPPQPKVRDSHPTTPLDKISDLPDQIFSSATTSVMICIIVMDNSGTSDIAINIARHVVPIISDGEHTVSLISHPFPSFFLVYSTYICIYSVNKPSISLLHPFTAYSKHPHLIKGGEEISSPHWGALLFVSQ
jgi:hypothetical protein